MTGDRQQIMAPFYFYYKHQTGTHLSGSGYMAVFRFSMQKNG